MKGVPQTGRADVRHHPGPSRLPELRTAASGTDGRGGFGRGTGDGGMSDLTEMPDWVWNLLDAVAAYEDEHPLLYRMTDSDVYERWPCFGAFLSERKAWPPRNIQDAAEFRRHVTRAAVRAHYRDALVAPAADMTAEPEASASEVSASDEETA